MRKNARYLIKSKSKADSVNPGQGEPSQDRNFGLSRVEGSMGAAGVISAWATLQLLGDEGLAVLLDHTIDLTYYAYDRVNDSKYFRPLYTPELNTLLIGLDKRFHIETETYNTLLESIRNSTDRQGFYISLNEKVEQNLSALRLVIMHPHTTQEDVDTFITMLEKELAKFLPI
jgi:glutamate/tyrosine decarboxylase-like PLP-dependent enzyme